MIEPCLQCGAPAFVFAEWSVGGASQEAHLCERCASEMWRIFGRSTQFNFKEPA